MFKHISKHSYEKEILTKYDSYENTDVERIHDILNSVLFRKKLFKINTKKNLLENSIKNI